MNFIQSTLQVVEVGKAQFLIRLVPLLTALVMVGGAYDFIIYHGLNDAQSMDNAQLARQIVHHQGFTTKFLRPQAVTQLRDHAISQAGLKGDLFPPDRFPLGTARVLPDTYNAPGYPYLLAAWFYFTRPEFEQVPSAMLITHIYAGERWIPLLNQGFLLMTAVLVFGLARRLFDDRIAWMSLVAFLGTDLVWHYTLTALSTSVLMFLVTAMLMCVLEIWCVDEACYQNEDRSFLPAWIWGLAAALLLGAACLTRLHLLVLLIPLFMIFLAMPRPGFFLFTAIFLLVVGLVVPWFLHVYKICGNPLGSNLALALYGQSDYSGNQIYCMTSIPSYENLFQNATNKETSGFLWHFQHIWTLLGSNPLILFFGVSIVHQFKRVRTRMFHWSLFGTALVIVAANNLGSATPEDVGPWNTIVLLLPCMIVMGCAFFFILLDRLNIQIALLTNLIVTTVLVITVAPMLHTLTSSSGISYNFPPYVPPYIKTYGQLAQPDEWITTDMPWATAWYADRPSLWLPDSISDFENLNTNVCPTGVFLLTPVSWSEPISTFTTGEYKDWAAFVPVGAEFTAPNGFPFTSHQSLGRGTLNYELWSDRPRWLER